MESDNKRKSDFRNVFPVDWGERYSYFNATFFPLLINYFNELKGKRPNCTLSLLIYICSVFQGENGYSGNNFIGVVASIRQLAEVLKVGNHMNVKRALDWLKENDLITIIQGNNSKRKTEIFPNVEKIKSIVSNNLPKNPNYDYMREEWSKILKEKVL